MKYTSQDFKFDHPFDFIRYLFSGLIFAPFRFTNEITRKIPYFTQDKLVKVNVWAIAINVILIAIDLVNRTIAKNWNPLRGKIPLVTYLVSLGFLGILLYFTVNMNQPKFKIVDKEIKQANKEKRESLKNQQTFKYKEEYKSNVKKKEENKDSEVEIPNYNESELNLDNVDNLKPSGVKETIEREIHLDVDDLQNEMYNSNYEKDCEIPSNVSEAKVSEAVKNDKFNIKGSGLNEVNEECVPNIDELQFGEPTDVNDIKLDLGDILSDDSVTIDLSGLDTKEFNL